MDFYFLFFNMYMCIHMSEARVSRRLWFVRYANSTTKAPLVSPRIRSVCSCSAADKNDLQLKWRSDCRRGIRPRPCSFELLEFSTHAQQAGVVTVGVYVSVCPKSSNKIILKVKFSHLIKTIHKNRVNYW